MKGLFLLVGLVIAMIQPAKANFAMSPSGPTTAFAIDSANQGTSLCAASNTECAASVPINTAGTPLFTSGNPGSINLQNYGGMAISTSNPIPVTGIGVADGTAIGSLTFSPIMGYVTTNATTGLTSGDLYGLSLTTSRALRQDAYSWAGTALGAPSNYGTSPGAVEVPGVNAFVTNTVAVSGASGAFASGAFASGSFVNATAGDPCMFQLKTNVAISTASGTTALVTGVSAKKSYVCSFSLIAPSAISVSLAEGSSATCGTSSQAAVMGVATSGTAANGLPLAANGGLTYGNGGGTVANTATAANYLCLFQSGTAQLAGNLTYVQQ